jgi:hypothetical protein
MSSAELTAAAFAETPAVAAPRLEPLDWMRGLVMVLMTVDHASGAFDAKRSLGDETAMWKPGDAQDRGARGDLPVGAGLRRRGVSALPLVSRL